MPDMSRPQAVFTTDYIAGSAVFGTAGSFSSILIQNDSTENLAIEYLDLSDYSLPTFGVIVDATKITDLPEGTGTDPINGQPIGTNLRALIATRYGISQVYTLTPTAAGGPDKHIALDIEETNTKIGSNIQLDGPILNQGGMTTVHDVGGSILELSSTQDLNGNTNVHVVGYILSTQVVLKADARSIGVYAPAEVVLDDEPDLAASYHAAGPPPGPSCLSGTTTRGSSPRPCR